VEASKRKAVRDAERIVTYTFFIVREAHSRGLTDESQFEDKIARYVFSEQEREGPATFGFDDTLSLVRGVCRFVRKKDNMIQFQESFFGLFLDFVENEQKGDA